MDVRGIVAELFAPGPTQVGLEVEFFTRLADGTRPLFPVLEPLALDFLPAGGRLTLEPGSQVEVSSAPHATAAAAMSALRTDTEAMTRRLADLGIELVGGAIDTDRPPERMTVADRYANLERELDRTGAAGRWMMTNTCALQVNVDGAQHSGQTWRVLDRVSPLLTAAFANSPGVDAAGRRWQSLRQGCWLSMDPRRAASPPNRSGDRVEDYVSYALAAPRLFPEPDGLAFGGWLAGEGGGAAPTEADFHQHLTTLFPPVRPRGWFEMRAIDMVPEELIAVVAQTVATLVEPDVVEEIDRVVREEPSAMSAARYGLHAEECQRPAAAVFAIVARHDATGQVGAFAEEYVHQGRSPGDTRPDETQVLRPPLSA